MKINKTYFISLLIFFFCNVGIYGLFLNAGMFMHKIENELKTIKHNLGKFIDL